MSQAPNCRVAAPARVPLSYAVRLRPTVALAVVSWVLVARQPGRVAGLTALLAGRVVAYLATRSSLMPLSLSHNTLGLYCNIGFLSSLAACCNKYTVLQHSSPAALPAAPVTIQFHCIVRLLPSQPKCNTPSVLQYKILPSFPPIPQYTLLYCDTTSLHQTSPKSLQYNDCIAIQNLFFTI